MRIESGATTRYVYFYAVDATDLKTPETGLSSFTVYRSRNGGAAAAYTTPTINETDSSNMPGVYELLVDEDTTIGSGNDSEEYVVHISHAGMAPVVRTIELYRPKITLGETIGVTSGAVDDVTLVATTTTNTDMRGTDNALLAASAPTNFGDLAITSTTGRVTVGTNNDKTGYSISGTKTTLDALNDVSTAQVNAEVDTALADYDPPTKAELDSGLAGLNDPTAAAIADAVWDEPLAGHLTAGSTGVYLSNIHTHVDTDIPAQISGLNDLSAAQVNAEVDTALADYDAPTKAELDSGLAALNDLDAAGVRTAIGLASANLDTQLAALPTAAENADAVWDEAIAGHGTAGSTGEALSNAGSGASAADIADAVWDEALSGHTTAGSAGKALADIETDVTAILEDTGTTLPASLTTIDGNVDSILADTGTDGVVISSATANQIADAMLNRDMSAVSDSNSRSPLQALRAMRNKWEVSGTTLTVYKENDTTQAWTSTVSTDASADPVTGSDPA